MLHDRVTMHWSQQTSQRSSQFTQIVTQRAVPPSMVWSHQQVLSQRLYTSSLGHLSNPTAQVDPNPFPLSLTSLVFPCTPLHPLSHALAHPLTNSKDLYISPANFTSTQAT